MLSFRLLRSFKVMAQERHFGRAAKILNITQPPLSQQIRQLETIVGAELFVRTTRQVELTEAGRVLLTHAEKLLSDGDKALRAVREVVDREKLTLVLAYTASAGGSVVPRALAVFQARYPAGRLQIREMTAEQMLEELDVGKIDIAVLRPPGWCFQDERFLLREVHTESMVLALLPGHPLAAHERVPVRLLDRQKFIGFSSEEARFSFELCQRIFEAHGVAPDIVQTSRLPTILTLVEAGMGVALVPESAAQAWSGATVYRYLLEDGAADKSSIYAATLSQGTRPSALEIADLLVSAGRRKDAVP